MKRITGNLTIFCLVNTFFVGLYGSTSITMEIADARGKWIDQVVVGVPFQLRVIIKGQNATGNAPHIEHPQDLVCKRSGIQMHSINGLSTTIYVYTAIASVAKKYTIGSATIILNGSSIKADPITFEALVGAQHNVSNNISAKTTVDAFSKPFMECAVSKSDIFVGETVSCTLRFYCPSHIQRVSLKQIQAPQCNECLLVQKGGQKEGVELIKQKPFKYIEWEFDVQFLKEGNIVLPPFMSEFTIEDEDDNAIFGGFSIFFQHNKIRQAQSNTVAFNVKPVPNYKGKPVIAVGEFTDFSASVAPSTITVNDAAVFSLRLTGVGNLSMINHPSLVDMPSDVKVYESQSKIESNAHHAEKTKLFEYIMQAVEPGIIKIPSQKLVFFDPLQEKHVIMKTKSVELHVKQTEYKASVPEQNDTKNQEIKNNLDQETSAQKTMLSASLMDPIDSVGNTAWHLSLTYKQCLFFIIVMLFFIFGYFISMVVRPLMRTIMFYRCAYFKARIAVKRLEKNNNTAQLINVFKNYVAARTLMPITSEDSVFLTAIYTVLKDQKCITEWNLFYAILIEAAYGSVSELHATDNIWSQAYYWLRLLKKKGM